MPLIAANTKISPGLLSAMTADFALAESTPLTEQSAYIYFIAVANEALKQAGGDPFCLRGEPLSTYRACWYNSVYNLNQGPFRDAGMRMVVGALRVNGVSVYGYKNPDDRRYQTYASNSHAWLEDNYGRIYDYIHDGVHLVVQLAQKVPTCPVGEIRGRTPAELKALGLDYIPATGDARAAIIGYLWTTAGWIASDILGGYRVRTETMREKEPGTFPEQCLLDTLINAQRGLSMDASWRAGLKRDGLKCCRQALAMNYIYELD
jgi:hypothetical protein